MTTRSAAARSARTSSSVSGDFVADLSAAIVAPVSSSTARVRLQLVQPGRW